MGTGVSYKSQRGRARLAIVSGVAGIAIMLAGIQVFGAGAAGPPLSRDINSYAIFAVHSFSFAGGATPERGQIVGNIGVNLPNNINAPAASICANGDLVMQPGSQLNADSVKASQDNCVVYNVNTNSLTGS